MKVLDPSLNFLGIQEFVEWNEAAVAILPVPLEITTTYFKGTAQGPHGLLQASHQVELYDDELHMETFRCGITTLVPMEFEGYSIDGAISKVKQQVQNIIETGKFLVIIGGEHALTVGAIEAYQTVFHDVSVLHLDGHADLRQSYEGSSLNHACTMARIKEMSSFVSVGVRSLCQEEADTIHRENLCIFDMHYIDNHSDWIDHVIDSLGNPVYITLDLDVFDPAVIPSVGTPEPGGLGWRDVRMLCRKVFQMKTIVGLDVVELCPRTGTEHGVFSAAKLVYRLIGYWMQNKRELFKDNSARSG